MNVKQLLVLIISIASQATALADDGDYTSAKDIHHRSLNSSKVDDAWISINNTNANKTSPFQLTLNDQDYNSQDELSFAWNLSDALIVNLSIFETLANTNQNYNNNFIQLNENLGINKNYNKLAIQPQNTFLDSSRNVSGYKLGISSKLDILDNYILNIGFDYGQLEDADLVGFNSPDVNTTSFELGFRKSRFGASLLTDTYLENNVDLTGHTRLGFELDWHFSDDTSISFGSKQRIKNSSSNNTSNSLDSLTGDVQYIKFQHNL